MKTRQPLVGESVTVQEDGLQELIEQLRACGYKTIGPQVADGAIIYDVLNNIKQLPIGILDRQDGGYYRLQEDDQAGHFDYVIGPHSLKNYLFPPRETLLELTRLDNGWQVNPCYQEGAMIAVIGARSCDLHALAIQDRVFLEGEYVDPAYKTRRDQIFIVAVNCRRAAATCFCHSMNTGPAVKSGFDLAITELDDRFVIEIGTQAGDSIIGSVSWSPCPEEDLLDSKRISAELERQMQEQSKNGDLGTPIQRSLETVDLPELLLKSLDHSRWDDVADRCLACANCTLVCPTCFCSSVSEVSDLTGDTVTRERSWASCFTAEHSYMSGGSVRKSIASRYRQWLTHKLATWIDQFGESGCVGCGRCITWCPVGIDLTEEVAAIRTGVAK